MNTHTRSLVKFTISCLLLGLMVAPGLAQDTTKPADAGTQTPQTSPPAQPEKTPTTPAQNPPAAAPAAPAAPAGPAPGSVSYSGLLDVYYAFNGRAPHPPVAIPTVGGGPIHVDNAGRSFDINDREPSFSLGEFNITRTEGKGIPFGITATLTVGDTARLVHANEPGGTSSWQTIQQLYLTKTLSVVKHDITFDFGAFVTPFGYEVIESVNNDEYSRGFNFQFGTPLYHAGLRANVALNNQLSLYGAIVNGWNNIADDNDAKSGIVQIAWKPLSTLTVNLTYMGGQEGTGAYGAPVYAGSPPTVVAGIAPGTGYIDTNFAEFQPTWQVTPKLKLAAEVDYGTGAGSVSGVHRSGTWAAYAGYARYQLTPRLAVAGRVEQFEDNAGAGGTGLRLGLPGYARLQEATLTVEYALFRGHLISRLEYRHDHSNQPFFNASSLSGGALCRDQDTVELSGVIKF